MLLGWGVDWFRTSKTKAGTFFIYRVEYASYSEKGYQGLDDYALRNTLECIQSRDNGRAQEGESAGSDSAERQAARSSQGKRHLTGGKRQLGKLAAAGHP
jgi:hypothetical protein